MRMTLIIVYFITASVAWSQDNDPSDSEEIDSVDLRVSVIENIDVTAEKLPAAAAAELDADIESILDDVEALEDTEASE